MKAMVLKKTGDIEKNHLFLSEITNPTIGNSDLLIRNRFCGVCRTDLHIIEGDLSIPELPIIPGHQIVGIVESIGKNVTGIKVGDRVGVPWMSSTCGKCDYCKSGKENLCDNARFTGLHQDGGYAELTVVPQQFVYPIPKQFPDEQVAPLLCAGIIGYRTLKLSGAQSGQRIGLYGFGASAHVTIQVARHWGCDVYVFTRSKKHQNHAESLGAIWTGTAEDNHRIEMDANLIFAPAGWLMIEALKRVKKGGIVVSAGIHMTDLPQFPYRLIYGEKTITTAANATYEDGVELLKYANEITIKTEIELYPLVKANQALQDLKNSKIKGAAVLAINN